MLVALLTVLLFGGAGTGPMSAWLERGRDYAKNEIHDEAQRRAVLATLDDMKRTQREYLKVEEKAAKALARLAQDRQTRSEDFQPALSAFFVDESALQEKVVKQRMQLRSQMTREQWAAARR